MVELLLEHGAGIEAKDKSFSQTPLSWAAEGGHVGVVELLKSPCFIFSTILLLNLLPTHLHRPYPS